MPRYWITIVPLLALGACATPQGQPVAASHPCVQEGVASWYSPQAGTRATASGEKHDASALTAAHPTLPFGSQVLVTNLASGQSVVVRIDDRGPVARGRIIDLSAAAAKALDMRQDGVARVRLEMYHPTEATASPAGTATATPAVATGAECLLPHTSES